jgi:hypothetical protein
VARKNKTLTNVQKYIRFLLFEKLDAPGANGKCLLLAVAVGGNQYVGCFHPAARLYVACVQSSHSLTLSLQCDHSGPCHQGIAEAALAE